MAITVCFDFGNTRKKAALFNNSKIKEIVLLQDDTVDTIRSLIEKYRPKRSILSSVINHNPDIENFLAEKTKFHKLNHLTKLSFTTPVGKPETIGADRLALSAGAVRFYSKKNNLVIGLGTCITYNFINKFHEFIGGAISPGMEMRLKSLNHYTAKLPLIEADSNTALIGYDTRTNILTGVIMGMAKEIDGFIDEYKKKFGNLNFILTGGDIIYLTPHLRNKIKIDPDLIFKGLYAISEVNNV